MNDADLDDRAQRLLNRTPSATGIAHLFALSDELLDSSTDRASAIAALIRARDNSGESPVVHQMDPSTGDPWRGRPPLTEVALNVQRDVVVHLELEGQPRVSLVTWRQTGATPPAGLEGVLTWAEIVRESPPPAVVKLAKAITGLNVGVPFAAGVVIATVAQQSGELSAVMSGDAIRDVLGLATSEIESELRAVPVDVLRRIDNIGDMLREWEADCVRIWPEAESRWHRLRSNLPTQLDAPDPTDPLNKALELLNAGPPPPRRLAVRSYRGGGHGPARGDYPLIFMSPRLALSGLFDTNFRPIVRAEDQRNLMTLPVSANIYRWAQVATHRLVTPSSTRMSVRELLEHLWWRLVSGLALGTSMPDPLPTSVPEFLPQLRAVLIRRGEMEAQGDVSIDKTMSYVSTLPAGVDADDVIIIALRDEALDDPLEFRHWGDSLSYIGSWAGASQAYGCAYALSDTEYEIGSRRDPSAVAFAAVMSAKAALCARRAGGPKVEDSQLVRIAMTLSPSVAREALAAAVDDDGGAMTEDYINPITLGAVRETLGRIVERQLATDFDGRLLPDVREVGAALVALDRFLLRPSRKV